MKRNRWLLTFLLLSNALLAQETVQIQKKFRVVLEPIHRTVLSAEVSSPVKEVNKKLGETFEEGDVLIQLDDRVFQANLVKAQAEEMKAETELDAKQQLFDDEIASFFEVKRAEADHAAAIAKRIEAERLLEATQILGPYNGKVVDVYVEKHELPEKGEDLMEVVDDEILIAQILIPSQYLPYIWNHRDFTIDVQETGKTIPAKVTRIGSVIEPSSSTVAIEAEIDNSKRTLLAGMRGYAVFQIKKPVPPPHKPLQTQPKPEEKQRTSSLRSNLPFIGRR